MPPLTGKISPLVIVPMSAFSWKQQTAPGCPQRLECSLSPEMLTSLDLTPTRQGRGRGEALLDRSQADPQEWREPVPAPPAALSRTHLLAGLFDCLHQKHLVGGPLLVVDAVLRHGCRPGGWVVGWRDFHSRWAPAGWTRVCSSFMGHVAVRCLSACSRCWKVSKPGWGWG